MFSRKFFDGRISEGDREEAEVELEFDIAGTSCRVVRGLFEPNELRDLSVDGSGTGRRTGDRKRGVRLQGNYAKFLCRGTGLTSFEQFVFLQLFLFTFDERRHLIVWDPEVLQQVVFLAFGVDPAFAERAERVRRYMEKQESIVRNRKWDATQFGNRLSEYEALVAGQEDIGQDVVSRHAILTDRMGELRQSLIDSKSALEDGRTRQSELSARLSVLEREYEERFERRLASKHGLSQHPIIVESMGQERCQLCGASSDKAMETIRKRAAASLCPLCGSRVTRPSRTDAGLRELRRIDRELEMVRNSIVETGKGIGRYEQEKKEIADETTLTEKELDKIEARNEGLATYSPSETTSEVMEHIERYKAQMAELLRARDEAVEKRDRALEELRGLQRELSHRYASLETEFVPYFRDLAYAFLGLEIDIRLDSRAGRVGLVLEVEGSTRRLEHQLSESQRFFLDIALRMAMAHFMTASNSPASLVIDTPEGSLDAAYESRAGEMFARFVDSGNRLMMTANINTSQLLRRMARRCGRDQMELIRMTEWAKLSQVQLEEQGLFEEALGIIEQELGARAVSGG